MAPCRPNRDIKITVPRFNSKKVSPELAKEIASVSKREKRKVDVKQTVDPTTALALAIVSLCLQSLSGIPIIRLGKCVGMEFLAYDCSR